MAQLIHGGKTSRHNDGRAVNLQEAVQLIRSHMVSRRVGMDNRITTPEVLVTLTEETKSRIFLCLEETPGPKYAPKRKAELLIFSVNIEGLKGNVSCP